MIGFAVLFGLLAVFLAQVWLNNQADQRMKSLEAQSKVGAAGAHDCCCSQSRCGSATS